MAMKNKMRLAVIFGVILSTASFADPGKTLTEIVVDSSYVDKNIVFTVMNPSVMMQEGVGLHKAGGPLISRQRVDSILDKKGQATPVQVIAFVTDSKASQTKQCVTQTPSAFSEGGTVLLSFPAMFVGC